jgi:hypothetical protein
MSWASCLRILDGYPVTLTLVMGSIDFNSVAARIRGLLHGHDKGDLAVSAIRLRVSGASLRATLDELDPWPTIGVLVAVVRYFGLDPNWLLTGRYDPEAHRRAALATPEEMRVTIEEILSVNGTAPRPTPGRGIAAMDLGEY